ncbi:SDR family oxidoreductase [Streptomyces antibioticus]|uniref:SDR family oxidoreductase n=1 Tax=Streptomyces antibioticus TaxID=1890 RepID=UPI0036DC2F7E
MPLRNGTPAHAAAKATPATHGKGPADETAPHCVRVNTVSPGLTRTTTADHPAGRTSQETDNTRQAAPNRLTDPPDGIPLNRPRRPADVTEPVAFPVPDHASAVTDAGHVIDSGTTPTR